MADYLNIARQALEPGDALREGQEPESLESVLKGQAVELWSTESGRLFIVADDKDAVALGEPRGIVYTAAEVRRIVRISDPVIIREIHEWKRQFNGCIREHKE